MDEGRREKKEVNFKKAAAKPRSGDLEGDKARVFRGWIIICILGIEKKQKKERLWLLM